MNKVSPLEITKTQDQENARLTERLTFIIGKLAEVNNTINAGRQEHQSKQQWDVFLKETSELLKQIEILIGELQKKLSTLTETNK